MKTNLLLTVSLVLLGPLAQAQTNYKSPEEGDPVESRYKVEEKKNVVKLYSKKEKGTVLITSHRSFDVQLYIFDLEGTMMHQRILKSREKTKVTDLAKGTYTYTIFYNDESIEEGQLIIK